MKFLNKYFLLILALFCLILITIWFKDGKLLATGEDGLMLVNPGRALGIYKYSWNEVRSGGAFPGSNTMIPLFYIESHILEMGIPIWLFQATIFFLLMFIGSISTYYLSKELFKNEVANKLKVKLGLIAALFYILNPISLLGVWYRGIAVYSFIFFYALAPLFFYLYIVGLNNKKKNFIIIAPLITLLLSSAFASPGPPLLLWLLPFLYSLVVTFAHPPNVTVKFIAFPLIYFIATFVFWILINLWWIFPYVEFSNIAYVSEVNPVQASNTLKANSADFTLDNVIRLIHGGFLYRNEAFGGIYRNYIFLLISWLIPIITIYGLLKLKPNQIKLFFAISLTLLLFLVKGTSPPFGGIFLWFFSHISFLQVFRNPLEKFGMLLPIIYAPLFSLGLFYLLHKIQEFKKRTLILVLALASIVAYHWPFFSGALVSFKERDIRVVVPPSFQVANKIIPAGNHIIFSIPVMGGASGFYKWEYGYKGAESSGYLFNHPVINTFFDANSFDGQLLIGFSNNELSNLTGIAQFFSADIIAYRKDTDVSAFGYNLDALERSEKMISQANLSKIFDSKEFSLWSLPKEKKVPIIYTPQAVRLGDSPAELISLLEENKFDPKTETFICIKQEKCKPYKKLPDQSIIDIGTIPEKVEVTKFSPVNYDIKVESSRGRFLLVFNNSYHPGWTALIDGKPISADKHIVANGYANGFIIDEIGTFNIQLQFAPEEKFHKFYKVSFIAIFLGITILSGTTFKILFWKIK